MAPQLNSNRPFVWFKYSATNGVTETTGFPYKTPNTALRMAKVYSHDFPGIVTHTIFGYDATAKENVELVLVGGEWLEKAS